MKASREKVLLLGDGVSAFLAVIRSLGRKGIEVHAAWCPPECASLRSRYLKRFHQLPMPYSDVEGNWVRPLASLLEIERYDLVIPVGEQPTCALHSRRDELPRHSRLYLLDDPAFDVVFDKVKSVEVAERLGLRIPVTRVATQLAELRELESHIGYPMVLKPISSFDPRFPLEKRKVVKAYNREELDREGRRLIAEGRFAVQENFIGRGVGVDLLVDRGEILLAFEHRRIHEPLRGGASSYRKSVPLNAELLDAARRFVAAIDYSGVIMVEFLVNRSDTDWRFVEANGRFWGSLPLAVAAGADFPYALYQLKVHGQREFAPGYRTNLYCRNVLRDALWFVKNLLADQSDPTLATVSPLEVLLDLRHFFLGRERFDAFTFDDPMPAVAEPLKYARRLARWFGLKVQQAWASLPGVRHRQAWASHAALKRARSVIFLCRGNICRSPFAAAYAERVWPQIKVSSRGLHFRPGRRPPRVAVEAADVYDVSLNEHRSSLLTEQDIAGADMIICFDEMIRRDLIARHPHARAKTFRFGALGSRPLAVADPYGKSATAFLATYAQIKETLDDSCALRNGSSRRRRGLSRIGQAAMPT